MLITWINLKRLKAGETSQIPLWKEIIFLKKKFLKTGNSLSVDNKVVSALFSLTQDLRSLCCVSKLTQSQHHLHHAGFNLLLWITYIVDDDLICPNSSLIVSFHACSLSSAVNKENLLPFVSLSLSLSLLELSVAHVSYVNKVLFFRFFFKTLFHSLLCVCHMLTKVSSSILFTVPFPQPLSSLLYMCHILKKIIFICL